MPCSQPRWVPVRQQLLAQEVGKMGARLDRRGDRLAVDGERDRPHRAPACSAARRTATACICCSISSVSPAASKRVARACGKNDAARPVSGLPPNNARRVVEHDRLRLERADHRAAHAARGIVQHHADGVGELAGLAADLVVAPARGARESAECGRRQHLAGASAVSMRAAHELPTGNAPRAGRCRARSTSAPSAARQETQSAAGSAWARLPPMVPRLRTAR